MLSDIRRLRQRVRDLEARLARMQQEKDVLVAAVRQHDQHARPLRPETRMTKPISKQPD
jgi:cell division septum initiation protein DivIVA